MSNLADAVDSPAQVTMPQGAMPNVGFDQTQAPTLAPQTAPPPSGGSRLANTLRAVAGAMTTGLQGIPNSPRPSFISGLGSGARAAAASEAAQQDIRFRSFQDQLRAAELHNQDIELGLKTDLQKASLQQMQDQQRADAESRGVDFDNHSNSGEAVKQTWQAQSAPGGGGAAVPDGAFHSADQKYIVSPAQDDTSRSGVLSQYKELTRAGIPGIVAFPGMDKAQFTPSKQLNIMTNILQGHNVDGSTMTHPQVTENIASLQAQRDALAKNGGTDYQMKTINNLLDLYKSNEKNHQDAEDAALKHQKQLEADAPQTPQQEANLQHTKLENQKLSQENQQGNQPQNSNLTGDAYLATLPASDRTLVQAIGTGKVVPDRLGQLLGKNPKLIQQVTQAFPDFDTSKASSYASAYKDFTSGATSKAINAGSTAFLHLAELRELNTNTSRFPGTAAHQAYENKVDTVATELAKFYGDSTVSGIANIKSTLNSTFNRDAAITTQAKSMGDKMDQYENQWQNAAPSSHYQAPLPGVSTAAKQARASLDPSYQGAQQTQGGQGSQQTQHFSSDGKWAWNGQSWVAR